MRFFQRLRGRVGKVRRPLLAATTAAALLATAVPASVFASDLDYSWSSCNWAEAEASGGTLTWSYDSFHPMPVDGWGDGVKNSFTDRVLDAVGRWNSALAGTPTNLHLVKVTSQASDIFIRYMLPPVNTPFGQTVFYGFGGEMGCVITAPGDDDSNWVYIYINPRGDWFTQDDTRRALWETASSTVPRRRIPAANYTTSVRRLPMNSVMPLASRLIPRTSLTATTLPPWLLPNARRPTPTVARFTDTRCVLRRASIPKRTNGALSVAPWRRGTASPSGSKLSTTEREAIVKTYARALFLSVAVLVVGIGIVQAANPDVARDPCWATTFPDDLPSSKIGPVDAIAASVRKEQPAPNGADLRTDAFVDAVGATMASAREVSRSDTEAVFETRDSEGLKGTIIVTNSDAGWVVSAIRVRVPDEVCAK